MSINTPLQQSPYLREQRQFPSDDLQELARQTDQAYIDIANKVNDRTIGVFAVNFEIVTGEQYYVAGSPKRQQSLRQLYIFHAAGSFPHGINFSSLSFFTHPWGSYTDGTNWYGVIYSNNNPIANQVTFYVTPTNIVVTVNGTAPVPTSIYINLEWTSQF